MVAGLAGRTGVIAQSRVVVEFKIDPEHVPVPLQPLEEIRVLGRAMKHGRATKTLAQVKNCLVSSWPRSVIRLSGQCFETRIAHAEQQK